jgi:hypothetical protein
MKKCKIAVVAWGCLTASLAFTDPAREAVQSCQWVYGSSPFASLSFHYKVVNREAAVSPLVDIAVTYTRSSFERGIEYYPIEKKGVPFIDVINNDVSFRVESTIDYAGGEIKFERDDSVRGTLAVLNYTSDGMDGFALYECEPLPEI